jgi:hypothetical protein
MEGFEDARELVGAPASAMMALVAASTRMGLALIFIGAPPVGLVGLCSVAATVPDGYYEFLTALARSS